MRKTVTALAISALFVLPARAEIRVISPPLINDSAVYLAAAYSKQTGTEVSEKSDVMGKLPGLIAAGPVDVLLLPPDVMDLVEKSGGIKPGSRQVLGYMPISLAVRLDAPTPDISTVPKLRAVLEGARTVAYSQPGPPTNSMEAAIIDKMMHRPEFSKVHTMTNAGGHGVTAITAGKADMALQATSIILAEKDVKLVGPVPAELGARITLEAAISSSSTDPVAAAAFIRYITSPAGMEGWKMTGFQR